MNAHKSVLSALSMYWSRRYDPHVVRSHENLWLNAFIGLSTFSGVLVAANVAIAVTRPHYPFWTTGVMIGAYIVGSFGLTCYLGALREWPLPLAGDRPPSGHAPLPAPPARAPAPALRSGGQVGPPPAQSSSAADLVGLGDQRIQILRVSVSALQDVLACLVDLDRVPRPSVDYAEIAARAQDLMERAKAQLRTLAQQVSDQAWPHRKWALSFQVAERKVQQYIETWQQPDGTKLAGSVADLLRLIAGQYPSLFRH